MTVSIGLAVVTAAAVVAGWGDRGPTLECALGGTLQGPCEVLDSVNVLSSGDGRTLALAANFGLLRADGRGGLSFVCEEALGGLAYGLRMAPDGTVFLAGREGVVRHRAACAPEPATGAVRGRAMIDVAFEPAPAGARVYALGEAPRALYLSTDGGGSFVAGWTFAPGEEVLELAVAPSRPEVVYAAGDRGGDGRLLILRSGDAGASFAAVSPGAGWPAGVPLDLLGIHPTDPATLLVAVRAPGGADEVWRSRDGGQTWARLLALPAREALGGFTFGATGDTLFVGSRQQFFEPGTPPGQLHRSSDGGQTWSSRPSGARGPRYRCLAHRDGRLYACAGGSPNGDDFLLGSSTDGGATWSAVMTVEELRGPEACHQATCFTTEAWLCTVYGLCGGDPVGQAPDGGSAGGGSAGGGSAGGGSAGGGSDGGGCACRAGGAGRGRGRGDGEGAPALLVLAALGILLRRRRWRLPSGPFSPVRRGEG